jgi:hypothetical protein
MAETRKNPNKLTGPEKTRFLSVLSKDPELQEDVVAKLRDLGVYSISPRHVLDTVADRARGNAQELAGMALDKVQGVAHSAQVNRVAERVQQQAAKMRERVGR